MEPVSTALAGLSLIKAAVDSLKSTINTANDVGSIAKYVDNLFDGRDQVNENKRKAAADPFGIKNIAEETINQKLAEEHLDEMRQLIDARFGFGTWASIVAERARRIQEHKAQQREARIMRQKKQEEVMDALSITGAVVVAIVTVLVVVWLAVTKGAR